MKGEFNTVERIKNTILYDLQNHAKTRQEFDQIEHDHGALVVLALIKSSHMHVGAVASTIDMSEAIRNLVEFGPRRMSLPEYCQKFENILDICTNTLSRLLPAFSVVTYSLLLFRISGID